MSWPGDPGSRGSAGTWASAGALALSLAGCSLVYGYPNIVGEEGADCRDGVDQDLDGRTDCRDPGCSSVCDERLSCEPEATGGFDDDDDGLIGCADRDCDGNPACTEDVPTRCADGRDNDLDGRVDARDAGCWPLVLPEVERCASALGGTVDIGPYDFDTGTVDVDPLGTGEGPWLRVVPVEGREATPATSTVRASGGFAGMSARAVLHLAPDAGLSIDQVDVGLSSPSTTRAPDAPLLRLVIPPDGRALLSWGVFLMRAAPLSLPPRPVRLTVEFEIDDVPGLARARVRVDDAPEVVIEGTIPSSATPTALALTVTHQGRSGRVWVESGRITRPTLVRCEGVEPPIGVTAHDGLEVADTALHSLVRGAEGVLCGAVTTNVAGGRVAGGFPESFGVVSHDDGASFTMQDAPIPSSISGSTLSAPPVLIAYDAVRATYHAAVLTGGSVLVASSADCARWTTPQVGGDLPTTLGADLLVLGTSAGLSAYEIDADGHRVVVGAAAGERVGVLWARSPTGEPGTWTFDDALDTDVPGTFVDGAAVFATLLFRGRALELGAAVDLAFGPYNGVRTSRGWEDVPFLALRGSGEAGAFDAREPVFPVALIEDACEPPSLSQLCGRFYYSGTFDDGGFFAGGWGHARIRLTPRPL